MYKVIFLSQPDYEYRAVKIKVNEIIETLGGISSFVRPQDSVLIKPNLLSARTPDKRVTTDPSLVRAAAEAVLDAGGRPFIGDSPPGIEPFSLVAKRTGMKEVSEKICIPLLELKDPRRIEGGNCHRFKNIEISGTALDADVIINLPKLKTHGQMLLTLGIKNMFGVIPSRQKAEWHYRVGLDRDIFATLLLDTYNSAKPSLTILDGIWGMEGQGPGNGKPRNFGILAGATDALAMDFATCRLLGTPPADFPLFRAAKIYGYSQTDPDKLEILGDIDMSRPFRDVDIPRLDSLHVLPSFLRPFSNSMISRPVQNPEVCIGCGECVKMCLANAIELKDGNRLKYDYDRCIRCFCCQEVCPAGAIEYKKGWLLRLSDLLRSLKTQH